MSLADGESFAGYTILRQLGAGGMGEVYLVQHPRLPRREALKILPATLTNDAEYRERFHREADIAATLWHSSIVGIHDRGEFDGQLWITMDYVEGTDAAQLLKTRHLEGLAADRALAIVDAMAGALDHAHSKGLLHRDVKPANILLTESDSGERRVMLADFGIARQQDEISGLTATNMTVGSVTYAAPEQLTGSRLDGRADQYALACTAFHLLAGQPPFENSNPAVVIGQHLTAPPPRLSSRRPELATYDDVLLRAMSKDPVQRFGTCAEFASALSRPDLASSPTRMAPAADATMAAPAAEATRAAAVRPQPHYTESPPRQPPSNSVPGWLIGAGAVLAVLVVALLAVIALRPSGGGSTSSQTSPSLTQIQRPSTVTITPATTSQAAVTTREAPPPPPPVVPGDLDLSTPMTRPVCDGTGIVVLYNAVSPGQYGPEIERALGRYPGASYLRTDQSCPSLRQTDDKGNAIYAVYRVAGRSAGEVCAAVVAAGNGAYGKWLDMTTNPRFVIPC